MIPLLVTRTLYNKLKTHQYEGTLRNIILGHDTKKFRKYLLVSQEK